jgi:tetratricopeptide (TPR) repeat protein
LLVAATLLSFTLPAAAQVAPDSAVDDNRRQFLFERLRNAMTEQQGRAAEDAVWRMWMEMAPDLDIARAVEEAMQARESYDFDGALVILDRVVAEAPRYSEGWNQRAFIRFLKDDLDGSLEDIERALELEPWHFAALAGKATILMRQGRMELGQAALRRAVEIHPWLRERSMLIPVPGQSLPGPGKDI